MVKILTDHVAKACEEMTAQARRRQNEIDAAEDVIRSLQGLSGMDGILRQLRKETEDLKEEQRKLLDMLQALIRIQEYYVKADKQVCDYAEGNVIRHSFPGITLMNLQNYVSQQVIKNVIK